MWAARGRYRMLLDEAVVADFFHAGEPFERAVDKDYVADQVRR